MVKEFILQDLDCANCAAGIERMIANKPGIRSASVNLATAKLSVEADELGQDELLGTIKEVVKIFEPDVKVIEVAHGRRQVIDASVSKKKLIWIAMGAALFFGGILLEYVLDFAYSGHAAIGLFAVSYFMLGSKVLLRMAQNILKGRVFDENFLMGIATIGAASIGMFAESVAVMLFYRVGEFFQDLAVAKSKKRIGDLMDIRPDYANLKMGDSTIKVDPSSVKVGGIFVVKPGEKVPLDGVVLDGEAMLDTAALTGESVPRKASKDDEVLSGCINSNGVLTIMATKEFGESTVSRILDLVENAANKKAPTETFITKFAAYYTPAVVILAIFLAVAPPLVLGGGWAEWISRALVFLVISCPCALVLSIPLGFFGGIGGASKKGILIKGGNYLEALANPDIVVFDKTGTLTHGVFKVTEIHPANGFSEQQLLELAATAEAFSSHPIANSILKEYGTSIERPALSGYEEIAGHGVRISSNGRTILAGNEKLMGKMGIAFTASQSPGTKVYVAVEGEYAGCIVIADELRRGSLGIVDSLKKLSVRKTVMLTGDSPQIANRIAKQVGLDEVYANLLPQEKVEQVSRLLKQKAPKKSLVFVGDGINDAPVLAIADIGVAMGGLGSDAAIEASDVVLMTDEPSKLVEAVHIARFTKKIVWQNIIASLGIKLLFLFLATLGVSSLWEAVFADVGVSLLAVLNSMRIMKMKV